MIHASFHIDNRRQLVERLEESVIVLGAYGQVQRSGDASFAFEQESHFWWLTGINEPEWWVIIDGSRNMSWLVSPDVSGVHQTFDGSLLADDARKLSGIDDIISRKEATQLLHELAKEHGAVYTLNDSPHAKYYNFTVNPAPKKLHRKLAKIFTKTQDCRRELAALRAIKQPAEIDALRRAISLTIVAFQNVAQKLPTLGSEYEVEAEFTYTFGRQGYKHAYDPIVASGSHACTLHYGENSTKLPDNGMVLIDIGARVDGYCADITRTYAVGKPSEREHTVHAAVETAHYAIIELLKPGLSFLDYQQRVDAIMKNALRSLDLLGSEGDYRKYFPHAISHGLGVDVHDSLGGYDSFQPGMVLTVEPGIYIPEEGIGVRIEDDILITETGNENLSKDLPTSL